MRLVYICSPLRGDMEANKKRADEYCAYAASCGVVPLAPHTIFTRYLDENIPEQRKQGLDMGLELLKRCDDLWVMGSEISEGMKAEIEFAKEEQMPILYISDELVQSGYKIRQDNAPLTYDDCISGSKTANYENKIGVINPQSYVASHTVTADDSLWLVSHGNGCRYGAKGQGVFAENILTGERAKWIRSDVLGIVDPKKLYLWVSDKPIKNETVEQITSEAVSDMCSETAQETEVEI